MFPLYTDHILTFVYQIFLFCLCNGRRTKFKDSSPDVSVLYLRRNVNQRLLLKCFSFVYSESKTNMAGNQNHSWAKLVNNLQNGIVMKILNCLVGKEDVPIVNN
ncbi:PREDICTED: uncharacterized protein LOC107341472 [Acropora digitifera]|uniref:uncharacterized protein LOC107341472 n=1 Tax=Acropora digitifera TaxID=70779 RepID=UPI00077A4E52|nr:PREDICTED: uncharacterized protein LOC107341472 [Acropora digitifera]